MKLSGEQYDERIIEVHWDFNVSGWRMMRFRDDKPHGNHRNVVENIIQSIADGVEKEAVRCIARFCVLQMLTPMPYSSASGALDCHPNCMESAYGAASCPTGFLIRQLKPCRQPQ